LSARKADAIVPSVAYNVNAAEQLAKLRAARESFIWAIENLRSYVGDGLHLEAVAAMIDLISAADTDLATACAVLGVIPPDAGVLPGPARGIGAIGNGGAKRWLTSRLELTNALLASIEQKAPSDGGPYR
jgi:hypothetical protein